MSESEYKILIVDDEEDLCEILQFNLEGEGYVAEVANSAEEALEKDLTSFHLILLDVMMDKMSGFKMAELIRKELMLDLPIVFITAKDAENDLVTGFTLGGDDYITKPFSVKEVILRVKAVLKRAGTQEANPSKTKLLIKELEMDLKKHSLHISGKKIKLTKKEFGILSLLIQHRGTVFARDEILHKVWEDTTIVTDRTVDVHLARIRKKIGKYGKMIKSASGYGYIFEN